MKICSLIFCLLSLTLSSCTETAEKVVEAKEAQRRSDSIMEAFKKIDDQLKSIDSSLNNSPKKGEGIGAIR